MSGTSMDGIDISIIQSDGQYEFYNILDDYFEYDVYLQEELIGLRDIILNQNDLFKHSKELTKKNYKTAWRWKASISTIKKKSSL